MCKLDRCEKSKGEICASFGFTLVVVVVVVVDALTPAAPRAAQIGKKVLAPKANDLEYFVRLSQSSTSLPICLACYWSLVVFDHQIS